MGSYIFHRVMLDRGQPRPTGSGTQTAPHTGVDSLVTLRGPSFLCLPSVSRSPSHRERPTSLLPVIFYLVLYLFFGFLM